MNDYDNIRNLELSSYKSIGSLNEDNLVATSDLSDAMSAICYNLSNMLDKRDENSIVSGSIEISGSLSVGENIAHGTSLTGGIGIGDLSGNPVEVEMTAMHGAAFNASQAFSENGFAANIGKTYAKNSVAFNSGTAYSSYSLAHGAATSAFGYVSHVEGEYTQTGLPNEIGNSSGRQIYGAFSHAEGDKAKAIGTASHAEGYSTYTLSSWSHAEGSQTSAFGSSSHSEGYMTKAEGECSHAEGDQTYAEGQKSHAEGGNTSALGFASHAEGRSTIARARYSHVEGACAESLCAEGFGDEYSYVWSGVYNTSGNNYPSHGAGSFSINPNEGINGFFIGTQSLCSIISNEIDLAKSHSDSAVQQLKSQISSVLSTIAADPLSSLTYSSDIDNVISAAVEMRNILSSLYDAMRS